MATTPLRPAFSQSPVFRDRLLLNVPRAQASKLRDRLGELGLETVLCREHQAAALEFPPGLTQETVLELLSRIDTDATPSPIPAAARPVTAGDVAPALSA